MGIVIGFLIVFGFGAWDSGVVSVEEGVNYKSECWNQSCGSQWNDLVGTDASRSSNVTDNDNRGN